MTEHGFAVRPRGERVDWVDTGRGTAITLVALFHAASWLQSAGLDPAPWVQISVLLSSLRMPMFFVLAGLFAQKWLHVPWPQLIRSKLLLFAWVFVVWEVIGTLTFMIGMVASDKPIGLVGSIKSLLLSPVFPRFELWFIWALALFFVIARLTRRVPPWIQLTVAGVAAAIGLTIWLNTTNGLTGSIKFYAFFLVGLYLRRLVLAVGSLRPPVLIMMFLAWLTVTIGLVVTDARGVPGLYFLNCLLGILGGIAISRALAVIRPLSRLGQLTLPVYLTHTPLIQLLLLAVVISPLHSPAQTMSMALPPAFAALAVAGSLLLYRLTQKGIWAYLYRPATAVYDRVVGLVRLPLGSTTPAEQRK